MLQGREGQLLEMVLLAIVLCCILIGSNRGLLVSLFDMVKNFLILVATIALTPVVVQKIPEKTVGREGLAYVIAFAVAVIVITLLGKLLRIVNDLPIASALNKLSGAVFGGVTGIFIVWTILALLGAFQEYEWCAKLIESAKGNDVVMWFQNCNPIPNILKRFGFPVM